MFCKNPRSASSQFYKTHLCVIGKTSLTLYCAFQAFGGAKRPGEPMAVAIEHFHEKLFKLPSMMKTVTGRKIALARNKLMKQFAVEFAGEAALSFSLA
jgi:hypothetical protein